MKLKTHTKTELVTDFVALIANGIECWTKAGEVVVRLVDECDMSIEDIAGQSDYLTEDIVAKFEQLGRKQIVPDLLVLDYPAVRHITKLPYSEQKRLVGGTVELLVTSSKGGLDTLRVAPENLTPQQCRQVFDGNTVRSVPGQRAYIESRKQDERVKLSAVESIKLPYQVKGKRVVFTKPCEMSARELAQILAQIE
jgi:hypothetical protein